MQVGHQTEQDPTGDAAEAEADAANGGAPAICYHTYYLTGYMGAVNVDLIKLYWGSAISGLRGVVNTARLLSLSFKYHTLHSMYGRWLH